MFVDARNSAATTVPEAHEDVPARDEAARFDALLAKARRLVAFDHYNITGMAFRERQVGTGTLLRCDWPAEFRERYLARRMYQHAPVVAALKAGMAVITEHDLAAFVNATPEAKRVEGATSEAVGPHLVAVPVRVGHADGGSVTLRRRDTAFSDQEIERVELMAPALHAAALQAPQVEYSGPLTPREVTVLRHVSHGRTSAEIALQLAISQRTVDAHIMTATLKLGASSRSQAVAEALRRGLIQ